jgi:hypothetical protein
MVKDFPLPAGLVGRFAIVKLWPDIKTAEDECIARLKISAAKYGIECFEVHADGRLIDDVNTVVNSKDVDFVLHLHYDTPKYYDAFSFVALWNPLQFYHEWGYQRTSRNLISHDDFISCSAPAADDHVNRMISQAATHMSPHFNLYHSVADAVYPPTLGERKLFYAGINWEAINGGKSRHQELLKRLDQSGMVRIYGPKIFLGVEVWAGYESYVKEIPFDGVSMLEEISKAGIALVLSSGAHKESELMSNRLFESIAAGALIICDENKFAKKFFGDSLLYIDTRHPVERIEADILKHMEWAASHPDAALGLAKKAQDIFREKFTLDRNLHDLYAGLSARKQALLSRQYPPDAQRLTVNLQLLMPDYSESILAAHIASANAQTYADFTATLCVDRATAAANRRDIEAALAESAVAISVYETDFYDNGEDKQLRNPRKIGMVIEEILSSLTSDAIVFVAPNERIFSNHLHVLAGSLARNPESACAATTAILKNGLQPVQSVHERIDFRSYNAAAPTGFARFIFRASMLPERAGIALPYLHKKPLAALVNQTLVKEIPSTVIIDTEEEFPKGAWEEHKENAVIGDFGASAFFIKNGLDLPSPASIPTEASSAGFAELYAANKLNSELLAFTVASQKELQNSWIPVQAGKLGGFMTRDGWAAQESWGKWGLGSSHTLLLPVVPSTGCDLEILFDVDVVVSAQVPEQSVEVFVGQKKLAEWNFRFGENNTIRSVTIPYQLLVEHTYARIEFRVKTVRSPASIGLNDDQRLLGMGLKRFRLSPKNAIEADTATRKAIPLLKRLAKRQRA